LDPPDDPEACRRHDKPVKLDREHQLLVPAAETPHQPKPQSPPRCWAAKLIVNGFIEPIIKELPMEYAVEMNRLIELQMEGSIG
jgi:hypothetical protein